MSLYSLPSLGRISRERLSSLILPPTTAPSVAVVDVRDADHVGGHIVNSMHVPSSSLDYRTPELLRKLADKQIVVFHCALSQQRGPSAALRYLRERESKGLAGKGEDEDRGARGNEEAAGEGWLDVVEAIGLAGLNPPHWGAALLKDVGPNLQPRGEKQQEVYVLDGGFVKWQEM